MKKLLLTLAIILASTAGAFAQTPYKVFCELVGEGNLFGTKVKISIDLGKKGSWKTYESKLVDENGKEIEFNSMVDAMDYMGKLGWNFNQAYAITEGGISKQNVYHWLLSKSVTSDEQVGEGIITKEQYKETHK